MLHGVAAKETEPRPGVDGCVYTVRLPAEVVRLCLPALSFADDLGAT